MSGFGRGGEGRPHALPRPRVPSALLNLGCVGYGIRFAPRVTTVIVPALSGVALPGAKS
jgi:hypothetical protein